MHAYMRKSCSAGQMAAVTKHYGVNGGHACPHRLFVQSHVAIPLWVVVLQSSAVRRCRGYQRQPTTCTCLEASRIRHVDPTDERLGIVILDWNCFALETA